jgi:Domain of unknown function (DUF5655)
MIELVHAPKVAKTGSNQVSTGTGVGAGDDKPKADDPYATQRIDYRLAIAPPQTRDVHEALHSFLMGLGDDVQFKELKYYLAFKRIKNFACVQVFPQTKT